MFRGEGPACHCPTCLSFIYCKFQANSYPTRHKMNKMQTQNVNVFFHCSFPTQAQPSPFHVCERRRFPLIRGCPCHVKQREVVGSYALIFCKVSIFLWLHDCFPAVWLWGKLTGSPPEERDFMDKQSLGHTRGSHPPSTSVCEENASASLIVE